MATNLGSNRLHTEDTNSETVRLTRLELNALMDAVLSIVNAAVTDGDTFQSNVDALDFTDLRKVVARFERPAPPE